MDFIKNENVQNMIAAIYCRKSTESEDKQAFSLKDQTDVNKKVAERHSLKVKKTFKESMSAKKRGRPLFGELIAGVERGKYQVIVCWALNRLSRNSVDGALLIELMDNKKLHAIVTPGKIYHNTGDDKLLLQIEFGLAKKYSDDLGPTVLRGMYSKLKRGWWPGRPKQGYLNKKVRGEVIQVVDEERFPLLRKAIEAFIEGANVMDILDNLNNKWGYRTPVTEKIGNSLLVPSVFYHILRDSFYYGRMVWGGEEVEVHPDLPRLMTEDEFWLIQQRLGRRGVQRPQKHKNIPYRGILRCSECGNLVVPYSKTKTLFSGEIKTYLYAKCSSKKRCGQPHISVVELETQLDEILKTVKISEDFHAWFLKWLKEEHSQETAESDLLLHRFDSLIEKQHKRKNNLLELMIDGAIGKDEYNEKKAEIDTETKRLEKERANVRCQANDWVNRAEKRLDYALYAQDKLANGDFREKTSVLSDLGSNFVLDHKILRFDMDSVLTIFKENHGAVSVSLSGREPPEMPKDGENSGIISQWWAIQDSNL